MATTTRTDLKASLDTTAALVEALETLIKLHHDWEPQGRATRRFCNSNDAAIAQARAAIAAVTLSDECPQCSRIGAGPLCKAHLAETTASALQACTGAVAVTVTDGPVTATSARTQSNARIVAAAMSQMRRPAVVATTPALTALEQQVLDALLANAKDCSGGDFACLEEVRVPGLNRQQLGGVVTSLETKQVISVDITYVNGGVTATGRRTKGDKVTQVQFNLDVVGEGYGGFTVTR